MIQAKYLNGTKVRIKKPQSYNFSTYPELQSYANQAGVILRSVPVLGFLVPQPWANGAEPLGYTFYYYEVRLEDATILHYVHEDYLEELKESSLISA